MERIINFVLPVRYPTEKAYGVTVGRTCEALGELGVKSRILAPSEVEKDIFGNTIIDITPTLKRSYPPRSKKTIKGLIGIALDNIQLALRLKQEFSEDNYFVIRELPLALLVAWCLPRKRVALEIHRSTRLMRLLAIKGSIHLRGLQVLYITPKSYAQLSKVLPLSSLHYMPMGVPKDFFIKRRQFKCHVPLRICFVGKDSSSGVDNNLRQFISMLSQSVGNELCVELHLVGLSDEFARHLETYANESLKIVSISHLSHLRIAEYLKKMDCGVIPYPESEYHSFRFPIKSLEFAAVGLVLLINMTTSILEIIPERVAIYFSYESKDSLRSALLKMRDYKEIKRRRVLAINWATNFSYNSRANKMNSLF